jgi:CRISPR-associated protein Cas2
MRTSWLVAYDISNPKRLRRVHRLMLGYGDGVQYSVFRCDLSPTERLELEGRLRRVIHHTEDRILFVDVGPAEGRARGAFQSLGQAYRPEERLALVV